MEHADMSAQRDADTPLQPRRRSTLCLLLGLAALSGAASWSAALTVEEVLVTGEHPGPGLWRVSSGAHELWILGTHAPLPQQMVWKSSDVENIIAQSQQIIGGYSVSLSVAGADAYRSKDAKLRQMLPRRVYSRWRSSRRKYVDRRIETDDLLPAAAAILLQYEAYAKSGLTYTDGVWREIQRLSKKYQVPITTDHQVDEPLYMQAAATDPMSQQTGVDYLTRTMDRLEQDLVAARARANAWATGAIETLQAQATADAGAAYLLAYSWPFLQSGEVNRLLSRADANWLAAAEVALTNNRSTFALLPIYLILKSDGLLAQLRAAGYTVEEPL